MLTIVPLISALGLHKTYRKNAEKVEVLRGLDLEVFEGEFVSVLGASGCSAHSTVPITARFIYSAAASTTCPARRATSCATAPSALFSSFTICYRS